jgi:NADPH:quinone reductase-like Zn-dependent oxidoreductase
MTRRGRPALVVQIDIGRPGTFADLVVVPVRNVTKAPAHLSTEQAAGLGVALGSAWRALHALQIAVAAGARVIVTSSSGEKLERALALGAATLPLSLQAVRKGGRVVVLGGTSGFDAALNVGELFSKQVSLLGSSSFSPAELAAALRGHAQFGKIVLRLRGKATGRRDGHGRTQRAQPGAGPGTDPAPRRPGARRRPAD